MTLVAANPWLLAGLLAVGLPVVVHLLTRARRRTIRFPTLHFLTEATGGRSRLYRLRTWLVLALRTFAILLLVLVFARLMLRAARPADAQNDAPRVVLVVDASLSMRAVRQGVTLYSQAQAEAAAVLDRLAPGTQAGVVFIGAEPKAALPDVSANLVALRERLQAEPATFARGRPQAALDLARTLLGDVGTIYVFSDFQRTNWGAARLAEAEELSWLLRPISAGVENLAITDVRVVPAEPVAGESATAVVRLFNASALPQRVTVRLELAGTQHERAVDLRPFASGEASVAFTLPRAGTFTGRAFIRTDNLPDDDVRYLQVRARDTFRVLVLSDADPHSIGTAAHLLTSALAPSDAAAPGVEIERRLALDTDQPALQRADAVVLAPPLALSGPIAEALTRRVVAGAHLIALLDGAGAAPLLGALAGSSDGVVSAPFRVLRQVESSDSGVPWARLRTDPGGPLALFTGAAGQSLSKISFRRHLLTRAAPTRESEIYAYYADGAVALSCGPAGRGQAAFINADLSAQGGRMAGSAAFPVLLAELLQTMRRGDRNAAAAPGEPWEVETAGPQNTDDSARYRLRAPDQSLLPATVVARGRAVRLSPAPPRQPGIHDILRAGPDGDETVGAAVVNVAAEESDTRVLPPSEIARVAGGRAGVLNDEGDVTAAGSDRPLWPRLLFAAAACLFAEMLLLALWRRPTTAVLKTEAAT